MRQAKKIPAGVPAIKQRFLLLNRDRLRRAQAAMRDWQRDFLDLLPLLFHVNHPILPGFVSKNTPLGVSDYKPSKNALHAAKKIAKSFEFKRSAILRYDIHALYLMGSSGTVAYSSKSDFDIWLCYRPEIPPERVEELKRKAMLIEQWADGLGLEVHFFLINPRQFRQGRHDDLSSESSGTAQHYLLLEEFYRTSLLIAGRFPAWWLVPPDPPGSYQVYLQGLVDRRFVLDSEFVDFGDVSRIPAEEFFGAALWQLFKGIDSPYKSVLKLLLMEVYAAQYPKVDLLCQRFKRAIHEGETDLDQLDPYMMLYRVIEEHLQARGEEERLEFVRRCFYFKVNEKLGTPDTPRIITWRRELMRELTGSWGWNTVYMEMLDSRRDWKINRVLRERKVLVDELTHSYRRLSEFARQQAGLAAINEKDMTVLGRKLYAAFERKAGKVEIINRGISDDLWEPRMTLQQVRVRGLQEVWALYRGNVPAAELEQHEPLKRAQSVSELVAWCYFNGLADDRTAVALHVQKSEISLRELRNMMHSLQRLYPLREALRSRIEDLERAVELVSMVLFVNVGVDPLKSQARAGTHLTTNRTDALSYSGLCENLALTFDQVSLNSWREVLTARYTAIEGLLACVADYLRWSPPSSGKAPVAPMVLCFSSARGEAIARRIKELFSDIVACFYGGSDNEIKRYVLGVEQHYYVLRLVNDALDFTDVGPYPELLDYLAAGQQGFAPVVIDRYALKETLLPRIYKINRPGVIQLVFKAGRESAEVYVVDERGALFLQEVEFHERSALINHFSVFFQAVLKRQRYEMLLEEGATPAPEVEFYEAVLDAQGRRKLVKQAVAAMPAGGHYFNVQVIGELGADSKPNFTIYCDHVEFNSLEHGEQLFHQVAAHILRQRRSGQRYPIYITDIDVPRQMLGVEQGGYIQTVHFLNHKKRIEQWLNEALARVVPAPQAS
ncbi:MAG TPA: class I adenylate cyclase [Gammaproteobacteria bacterium]|nr:class I adenylate cyclase [Gammaproteobacteria bacterium]